MEAMSWRFGMFKIVANVLVVSSEVCVIVFSWLLPQVW